MAMMTVTMALATATKEVVPAAMAEGTAAELSTLTASTAAAVTKKWQQQ
jgi:hypothetical protein